MLNSGNTNRRTGLKFGILEAGSARQLLDDIQCHGVSTTYEAAQEELRATIEPILGGFDGEGFPGMLPEERLQARDELLGRVLDQVGVSEWRGQRGHLLNSLQDLFDLESGTIDIQEAYEVVLEEVRDGWQFDEEEYERTTPHPVGHPRQDQVAELLTVSFYGGQQLIWVHESQFCTPCQPGAFTVAGAGLLDKSRPDDLLGGETLAHCPDPGEWKGWEVIYPIVDDAPDTDHPLYPEPRADALCECGRTARDCQTFYDDELDHGDTQ